VKANESDMLLYGWSARKIQKNTDKYILDAHTSLCALDYTTAASVQRRCCATCMRRCVHLGSDVCLVHTFGSLCGQDQRRYRASSGIKL
jgi:hypothetical protein